MVFKTEGSFRALEGYPRRLTNCSSRSSHTASTRSDWCRSDNGAASSLAPGSAGTSSASTRRPSSDFAVFIRYDFDFLHKIPARHPSPPALTLKELDEFLSQANDRYRVAWLR